MRQKRNLAVYCNIGGMADELHPRNVFLTVLKASFMILLNVLSLLGNVLVCMSVYRNTRLRTSTNLYISALAISDLLSAIFVMPLAAGVLISGRCPLEERFAKCTPSWPNLSSIFHLSPWV